MIAGTTAAELVLTHGAKAIEIEDVEARVSETGARGRREQEQAVRSE
jgi:hypothetical protein